MERRKVMMFLGVVLLLLLWVPTAGALTFTETFLGTDRDNTRTFLDNGWRAEASFNLVSAGDQLKVYNALTGGSQQGSSINPNPDASGFIANGMTITSAHLKLTISDTDWSWSSPWEPEIVAVIGDGTTLLSYTTYYLGDWDGREYKDFDFDLVALSLASYLADGKYLTLVLANSSPSSNDFSIDQVKLEVVANPTATPEPMSLLLLGLGILGIGAVRRKK